MRSLLSLKDRPSTWATYLVLICALSCICFGYVVDHGLTDYDDYIYLNQGAKISEDFWNLFDAVGMRPTTYLVVWLAHEIWGDHAGLYHLLSVCVHTMASILLAAVCRRLGASLECSFLAGALFLTTVAHFRAVLVISSLSYPMGLALGLIVVLVFRRIQDTSGATWLAKLLLPLAAMLSALAHPAILGVLVFRLFTAYSRREDMRVSLVRLLPAGLLSSGAVFSLVYFYPDSIQTYQSIHVPNPTRIAEHFVWLTSRLITTAHWLPLPVYAYQRWELFVGFAATALLVFLGFRKGSTVSEWCVWTAVTILPFSNRLQSSFHEGTSGPSNYLYMARSVSLYCSFETGESPSDLLRQPWRGI